MSYYSTLNGINSTVMLTGKFKYVFKSLCENYFFSFCPVYGDVQFYFYDNNNNYTSTLLKIQFFRKIIYTT